MQSCTKGCKLVGRGVLNHPHPNAPDARARSGLGGDDNISLLSVCRPGHALLQPTHQGLSSTFHPTAQSISIWVRIHRPSQLVQPGPGRLITAQPEHAAVTPVCCPPFFWLVTYHIARNHITSGFRVSWKIVPAVADGLTSAAAALEQSGHEPRLSSSLWHCGRLKTIWPPKAHQMGPAVLLGRKTILELLDCPRVVLYTRNLLVGGRLSQGDTHLTTLPPGNME